MKKKNLLEIDKEKLGHFFFFFTVGIVAMTFAIHLLQENNVPFTAILGFALLIISYDCLVLEL